MENGVYIGNGKSSFQNIRLNVHCFVVDGILIDTGAQSLAKEFSPFIKRHDFDQVMITHYHEDHTGCAGYVQGIGKPIFMNEISIPYCQTKADYPLYRRMFWGKRRPFRAEPIGETITSRTAVWDVIDTPGHAIDHKSFLNRETGQLFTGDLYCQERTKVVLREESIPTIIDSLQRVLTFDFEDVFCSHAGLLEDGKGALRRKLDYLLHLQGKIFKLHDEGYAVKEINDVLFPKKYPITKFSSGEWDSLHIVNSVLNDREGVSINRMHKL